VPLLQDALSSLPAGHDRLRVRLLTRLGGAWRSNPERRADCDRLTDEAVTLARRIDDPISLGFALAGRFWATWWPDNPERHELVDEMLRVGYSVGDGERIAEAHLMKFISLFERGLIDDARAAITELSDILPRLRQPGDLWLDASSRIELALFEGNYSAAEDAIKEEAQSTYHATPGRDDVSATRMHMFLLRRDQGRMDEQEDNVRASAREFPWYPMHRAALACLLAEQSRRPEARRVLAELATDHFAAIYQDNEWLLGMCLASQAFAVLGDNKTAAELYSQLKPYAGRHAVGHAEGSVGWIDTYLGLLAATTGDLDVAVGHLQDAVDALERDGGRPWLARAQHDLARALRQRGMTADLERARDLNAQALRTSAELGMALADEIRRELGDTSSERADTAEDSISRARFSREGDYWIVEFGADSFRVHDSKGMHHLARLVRTPGMEVHALELVSSQGARSHGNGTVVGDDISAGDPSDTGPLLDAEAKAAYRQRLALIDEEMAEAERWNDSGRGELLADEREALIHELAAAVGLGNRDRPSATSSAERARVSVTRAIRGAMDRLRDYSPSLGAHLEATIRTGTFCAYVPDPRAPIEWQT